MLGLDCLLYLVIQRAPGGGRTHTWTILSRLPLPLGYRGLTGESTCPFHHLVQHRLSQLASEGVLLAGMVTPNQKATIPVFSNPLQLDAVPKPGNSLQVFAHSQQLTRNCLPSKASQGDYHFQAGHHQFNFLHEKMTAVIPLHSARFITWRRASDRTCDSRLEEFLAILP